MMTQTMQDEMAQGLRLHHAGDLPGAARLYAGGPGSRSGRRRRELPAGDGPPRAGSTRPGRRVDRARGGLAPGRAGLSCQSRPGLAVAGSADRGRRRVRQGPGTDAPTTRRPTSIAGSWSAPWGIARRPWSTSAARVELNPRLAQARTNLGELLLEMGRARRGPAALPGRRRAPAGPGGGPPQPRRRPARARAGPRTPGRRLSRQRDQLDPEPGPGRRRPRAGCDPARGPLEEALGLAPTGRRARAGLGRVPPTTWRRPPPCGGSYPEVKVCCERILAIDPGHAVAHNALGWILQGDGRHDEARQHYQRRDPARAGLRHGPLQPRRPPRGDGRPGRRRGPLPAARCAATRPTRRPWPGSRPCCATPCRRPTSTALHPAALPARPASGRPGQPALRPGPGPRRTRPVPGGRRPPRAGQCPRPGRARPRGTRLRARTSIAASSTA